MMWKVETSCGRHMNFFSGNFFHVSKLNEFLNELTISVVYIWLFLRAEDEAA